MSICVCRVYAHTHMRICVAIFVAFQLFLLLTKVLDGYGNGNTSCR